MGNCVGMIVCTNMVQNDNNINGFKAIRDQKEMEELVIRSSSSEELGNLKKMRRTRRSKQNIINIAGKNMTVKMKLKLGDDHDHDQDQDQDHQSDQELVPRLSRSSSTVRIKVVISQKELMKILNDGSNYSSVDHLLTTIKNTKSSHANGGGSSWKPALDSIIEDI